MPALLLYLLKANVALALFFLAYHFVLRRLTFYNLNRAFLLFGILFSLLYPLVDLSGWFSQHEELAVVNTYVAAIPAFTVAPATPELAPAFDYWLIPVYLFWLGTAVVVFRLVLQFVSLYRIHSLSEPALYRGIGYRQVKSISHAFSFWQSIYLNPEQHKQQELDAILNHELVHVKGWHTLDVLLTELSALFYWFNPGGWLMKKAIKENLEFIADQSVLTAGVDRKAYQYLLLKVTGVSEPQIANQFNFSPLKTRIAMMNKTPSGKAKQLRILVVLPLIAVLLVAFKSASQVDTGLYIDTPDINISEKQTTDASQQKEKQEQDVRLSRDYQTFLDRNPSVNSISWIPEKKVVIKLRSGKEEVYQLDNEQSIAAAEKKYGKLPYSPPVIKRDKEEQTSLQGNGNKAFYARNPQVRKLEWISGNEIRIRLETTEEIYNLEDKSSRAAAEKKYGKLPSTFPQAEVVTQAEFEARAKQGHLQENGETIFIPEDTDYYQDRDNLPVQYTNFLKKNPSIKKVGWKINKKTGPQAIVLFMNAGGTESYDLNDAKSMATAKNKYGELPGLLPPPPPVRIKKTVTPPPAGEQLPTPPPPASEDVVSGFKGSLIEDKKAITYLLYPESINERKLAVAKEAFKESGFDFEFKEIKSGGKLTGVTITVTSKRQPTGTSATYTLKELKEKNLAVMVNANKTSGKTIIKTGKITLKN